MPVQIVYKKAFAAIFMHPLQHTYHFIVGKMMTKKRRKNDVWFGAGKVHQPVIAYKERGVGSRQAASGDGNAVFVEIYPC